MEQSIDQFCESRIDDAISPAVWKTDWLKSGMADFQPIPSMTLFSRTLVLAQSVLLIALTIASSGCNSTQVDQQESRTSPSKAIKSDSIEKVKLKINIPDQDPIELSLECQPDSTVFDLMSEAKQNGQLKFESRGSEETVFVTSIGGIENSGSSGPNWIYTVNSELGECSIGVKSVQDGDTIEWTLGKPDFNN